MNNQWFKKGIFDPRVFTTVTLIVINCGVFTGLSLYGKKDALSLLQFGAQFGPSIWKGEYWRLFTTIFLHFDPVHLIFNMYALYVLGWLVEPLLGRRGLLGLYIYGGVAGSVLSVIVHPQYISVGASGAIFGLGGAALAGRFLFPTDFKKDFNERPALIIIIFIIYNLIMGFLQPSVDNASHLGGVISGFVVGYYLMARRVGEERALPTARFVYLLFSLLLAVGLVYAVRPVYSTPWCLWYAENMRIAGRTGEAEQYYRRAVRLSPEKPAVHRELGAFLMAEGRTQDALEHYKTALKLGGDKGELYYLSGVANLVLGNTERAYEDYGESVRNGYFNSRTLMLLGNYRWKKGEFDKALDVYIRAVHMEPDRASAYQALLTFLTRPGAKYDTSVVERLMREISPRRRGSLFYSFRATYEKHFRHFDRALEYYKQALEKRPDDFSLHYDIAWCLCKMGRLEDADRETNLFLAGYPDISFPGLGTQKNVAFILKLRIARARDGNIETSRVATGKNPVIRHESEVTSDVQRLRKIIEENYRQDIEQERNVLYLNNLAWHYADENYNTDEAVTLAREAAEKSPRAYTLDTLAWALFKSGRFKDALEAQHRALAEAKGESRRQRLLPPEESEILSFKSDEGERVYYYHLAVIQAAMTDRKGALESLDAARSDGVDFEDYEFATALERKLGRDSQ
jgi:rhomboid protease GluP